MAITKECINRTGYVEISYLAKKKNEIEHVKFTSRTRYTKKVVTRSWDLFEVLLVEITFWFQRYCRRSAEEVDRCSLRDDKGRTDLPVSAKFGDLRSPPSECTFLSNTTIFYVLSNGIRHPGNCPSKGDLHRSPTGLRCRQDPFCCSYPNDRPVASLSVIEYAEGLPPPARKLFPTQGRARHARTTSCK